MGGAMLLTLCAWGGTDDTTDTNTTPDNTTTTPEDNDSQDTTGDSSYPQATWTAANVLASDSVYGFALHKFADLIQEKSGGAITIEVYDAGSLGVEKECMEGLQMGTVDFWVGSTATCSNFTDSQTIYDLPYLFQNAEIAREVLPGNPGPDV